MEAIDYKVGSKQSILDPRTKFLLLVTISSLMLSSGNDGVMRIMKPVLMFIPFVLVLIEGKSKLAFNYVAFYIICFGIEMILLKQNTQSFVNFMLLACCAVMTRFAPGIMMGRFLLATTSVSEFVTAMKKMHLPDQVIIPMSVIFRFFPTIAEEYGSINDAMRMRGILMGRRSPIDVFEYRLVPLIISTVKIGDELSAAALTRGLSSPDKRTNYCKIGIKAQDIFLMVLCFICIVAYFFRHRILL